MKGMWGEIDSYDGSILLDNAASPESPLVFIQVIV